MSNLESKMLNQLVERISAIASLDFSKKIKDVKGDGTPLDTIAIGLNMLSEELEDSVVSADELEDKNTELQEVILKMNEFKYALDSTAIVVITDVDGVISYVNDKFCQTSKYSREELIGQNLRIVSSGYHPREFWEEMWGCISKGEVWKREVKNKAKDGSVNWTYSTVIPFLDNKQRPNKFMTICVDITEKKLFDHRVFRSIISTNEQDRELFAEDLHEGLAQALAALMMQVGVIEMKIQNLADTDLKSSVAVIKSYIQESIENTRVMATDLMPRTMMRYGIEPSLRSYISKLHEQGERFIVFNCQLNGELDKDIEITLYRTIVAVLVKASMPKVSKVIIHINNTAALSAVVEISCHKGEADKCTIGNQGLTTYQKRIELLGGQLLMQKLRDEKLMITIKF